MRGILSGRTVAGLAGLGYHDAQIYEPEKMREVARAPRMPEGDIVLNYAERRTYDTCYWAKAIFGLTEVVVVTQRYHLPRALYTCQRLGLEAVGDVADRQPYLHIRRYWAREVPTLWPAWWDRGIRRPQPVLGDPIPIF